MTLLYCVAPVLQKATHPEQSRESIAHLIAHSIAQTSRVRHSRGTLKDRLG